MLPKHDQNVIPVGAVITGNFKCFFVFKIFQMFYNDHYL